MKNSCKSKIRFVVGIDPSGNYKEGNGTTGIAVFDKEANKVIALREVCNHDYTSWEAAFSNTENKIWDLLEFHMPEESNRFNTAFVIEDYLLYGSKANSQINSYLETPRLIGYLGVSLWEYGMPVAYQKAVDVKKRWSDEILEHHKYIVRTGNNKTYEHCHGTSPFSVELDGEMVQLKSHHLDAIRHAVHYAHFGKE